MMLDDDDIVICNLDSYKPLFVSVCIEEMDEDTAFIAYQSSYWPNDASSDAKRQTVWEQKQKNQNIQIFERIFN